MYPLILWQLITTHSWIGECTNNSKTQNCQWDGEQNTETWCKIKSGLKWEYGYTQANKSRDSNSDQHRFNIEIRWDHSHLHKNQSNKHVTSLDNIPCSSLIMSNWRKNYWLVSTWKDDDILLPESQVEENWAGIYEQHF